MKKIYISVGIVIISIISVTNSQNLLNGNNDILTMAMAMDEVGNEATCYSTYKPALFGGTMIWVCGSCVQAQAKSFSDSGTCYF